MCFVKFLFRKLLPILPGILLIVISVPVYAVEDIVLITHKNTLIESLTHEQTINLFLGLCFTKNLSLIPFDQSNRQLRQRFYLNIANLSLIEVRAHWAKQVFTGRGHPPKIIQPNKVEQLLQEVPGAITYIPASQLPENSKILLRLNVGEEQRTGFAL